MNLKVILSATVLLLLLTQIDRKVLGAELSSLDYRLFALATLAIAAQILFLNIRWHIIVNAGRNKLNIKTTSIINISGIVANTLFISSVGGIVTKVALSMHFGISALHSVFATFIDRFLTLFTLLALCVMAVPVLGNVLDQSVMSTIALCNVLAGLLMGTMLIIFHSNILKTHIFTNTKRIRLLASFNNLTKNNETLALILGCSLASQICFIVAILFLVQSFDYQGSIFVLASLLPVLALVSSMPISIGGWGVREGAFIYGLGLIGFAKESALLLSIQVGIVTLITPVIIGLFFMLLSSTFRQTARLNFA